MRFQMGDGKVVDTEKAKDEWREARDFDGRNMISRATGDQWHHETLFRSASGRYYIVHDSDFQGSRPCARWVSREEAARWLLLMDEELPEDLRALEESLVE
jgi:hypothetical protein